MERDVISLNDHEADSDVVVLDTACAFERNELIESDVGREIVKNDACELLPASDGRFILRTEVGKRATQADTDDV